MADWTGEGVATAQLYQRFADHEIRGSSPSYEAICRAVAASATTCALLEQMPVPKRQPNLLLGAVRYLGGPTHDPDAFLAYVHRSWDVVRGVMLTHRTQTNEPGRCATLLPLLAQIPGPLALLEVGASAGLCLYPDRYAYRWTTADGEHALGDADVVLRCAVTGPAPLPSALPEVVWRAGIDLNPLRADDAEDRRWLRALIWPEHTERADRFDAACDVVATDPPLLVRGDLIDELPRLVAQAPERATVVVLHSAVLAYLGPAQRAQFVDLVRSLDVRWIANEAPGVVVEHPHAQGRFVLALDGTPVAVAGGHGNTLDWFDAS